MTGSSQPRAPRVQASAVRMRDAFVESKHGPSGRERFRQAASPGLRDVLCADRDPAGGWVPFELFVEATVLADRLFGKGDLELAWEMGRFAASHNIGVWKGLIMRHASPSLLMGITGSLWSHHYDAGRLTSRSAGPSSLIVSILDFPEPHRAHCRSIGGWIEGSLELGPRRKVEVRETSCRCDRAALCEYMLSWR